LNLALIVEWSDTMNTEPSLAVTLSAELFELLSAEARELGLPLEWLVASLVVDTVDEDALTTPLACCA
jgi:hypothetical protein